MPSKGEDLDAAIASALTAHVSNVDFLFTQANQKHPSNSTEYLRGNFTNEYSELSGMEDSVPVLSFESRLLSRYPIKRLDQVGIVGGLEYLVTGMRPSGRGRTLLTLSKRDAQT